MVLLMEYVHGLLEVSSYGVLCSWSLYLCLLMVPTDGFRRWSWSVVIKRAVNKVSSLFLLIYGGVVLYGSSDDL